MIDILRSALRPYAAIAAMRAKALLQYRVAAIAGFATQLFWGAIRCMIFTAFYSVSAQRPPMSLPQVTDFVWLTQATLVLIPWGVDADIQAMVRSGAVGYELLRPANLGGLWFARAVAHRSVPMIMRAVPLLVLAWLFFGFNLPPTWSAFTAWILALGGAVVLSAAIVTVMNVSLLFTLAGEGVTRLAPGVIWLFSGLVLPLPLFPDRWQRLLAWLPFGGLADAPPRLFMGHIPASDVGWVLLHQVGWAIVLVGITQLMLRIAIQRMVVQGG